MPDLTALPHNLTVGLVSTCPPRQCGIATFSKDLEHAIQTADPSVRIRWAAINEATSLHAYGPEVRWRIRQGDVESYRRAAFELNASSVDVVCLQHEFGLYGIWGNPFYDHLIGFLEELNKPLVTTLHSVLPEPSLSVRASVRRLAEHSHQVVVMAERARSLLLDAYDIDRNRITVIPHGVPPIEPHGRLRVKDHFGIADRTIITTFGLVDPRKGLEYMIHAMTTIRQFDSSALYLIVGKTHPELIRRDGETYRRQLWQLVKDQGLEQHVDFVDEYLTQAQIVDYLLASDIYVTPYLDPNQITSGTLAYALGAGKAIVSTPYAHALEVLAKGRGLLVPFRSDVHLADAISSILADPTAKRNLERKAYTYGRETAWPRVGERMLSILQSSVATPFGLAPQLAPVAVSA
jgi:glycosyltransferase involved in cell wall biosynthesis